MLFWVEFSALVLLLYVLFVCTQNSVLNAGMEHMKPEPTAPTLSMVRVKCVDFDGMWTKYLIDLSNSWKPLNFPSTNCTYFSSENHKAETKWEPKFL